MKAPPVLQKAIRAYHEALNSYQEAVRKHFSARFQDLQEQARFPCEPPQEKNFPLFLPQSAF